MKKKIFVTYIILLLLETILTGLFSLSFIKMSYLSNIEEMLITDGNLVNKMVEDKIKEKYFKDIDFSKLAKEYSKQINARITFINRNGVVVGDSEIDKSDLKNIENHMNRPEIKKALKGIIGKSQRYSSTLDINYLYVAVPVVKDGIIYGVTRLAYPLNKINKIYFNFIKKIVISMVIGVAVAMLLGYRYINRITEPIKEITVTAQKISNGDFSSRVYVESEDEVKILADTFNLMAEKLNDNISELQDKNTKLKSILTSMKEGLIAIDNSNRIILINSPAKKLFNIEKEDVLKEEIFNLINNEELKISLEKIINDNDLEKIEVAIDEPDMRILKIYKYLIKLNQDPNRIIGKLILIVEVTEMRRLEKMRTEFVANVSHELKTPLTSILGFVETLKNGAIDNEKVRDKFLNIIEIEAERLTRLIDDLLTLSDIESNKLSSNKKEYIDVYEEMIQIKDMMEEIAKQKDIEFICEIQESLPNIYGNRDWFKQMIINLVDNAIKYTPEGGIVRVSAYEKENSIFISVKDTGIGIPKKDIPRLFERFYRVDKARSRKVGGTGLGLAIVKHIVLSFGGKVDVYSEEGKGAEFLVKIPL
ncbi:two-component system histidine kinase PnpS [Caminicella sporogenes]|uniref:two-component system histidine kinase PnpS n=1 Tax=Caminicella sporogenes TaxID=166485 RepID=UPI002540E8D7|nr:ATP-binding protein [Caminicella sporogenes]WIF95360.1 ATP-binding protein [Caminicella sporogenes]